MSFCFTEDDPKFMEEKTFAYTKESHGVSRIIMVSPKLLGSHTDAGIQTNNANAATDVTTSYRYLQARLEMLSSNSHGGWAWNVAFSALPSLYEALLESSECQPSVAYSSDPYGGISKQEQRQLGLLS